MLQDEIYALIITKEKLTQGLKCKTSECYWIQVQIMAQTLQDYYYNCQYYEFGPRD